MGVRLMPLMLHQTDGQGHHYTFWCPGCKHHHHFSCNTSGKRPSWTFNGNLEKPTFTPSLLCWVPNPDGSRDRVCHLFVTDGKIQYLGDCFHEFAAKTIEMVDVENH